MKKNRERLEKVKAPQQQQVHQNRLLASSSQISAVREFLQPSNSESKNKSNR